MFKKALLSLAFLSLVVMAGTVCEAKVSTSDMLGDVLREDAKGEDAKKWLNMGALLYSVQQLEGVRGLNIVCRQVLDIQAGGKNELSDDSMLETETDRMRCLMLLQYMLHDTQKKMKLIGRDGDMDMALAGKAKACLEVNVEGFDGAVETLTDLSGAILDIVLEEVSK